MEIEKSFTDRQRLDFLCNLPTFEIIKKFSTQRGAHWPYTINIINRKKGYEFNNFRDAVDDAMRRNPIYIKNENTNT